MISFEYLSKPDFPILAQAIFDILADNMSVIAPTGNCREEDFKLWFGAVSQGFRQESRQIILIKDDGNIMGFFQYFTNADTFMMEEIQFKPEYQGKGVFRELYSFVLANIKDNLKFVEAYASIQNTKSIAILQNLGLSSIGVNKNGRSYHMRGKFCDLVKWYESK